jgi:phage terminase large subunit-like protein
MSNGSLKAIEKLCIGDEVLCWDGDRAIPGKVIDIPFDDYSETWKAITAGGLEVEADATHCFPAIVYRRRGLEKHTLAEIRDGGYRHKRFIKPSVYEYKSIDVPFSGLLLGLYLGDGSYGNVRPVNFTNTNIELLKLFKDEVCKYFPGSKCSIYKSDNYRIWVTLSGIKKCLDSLGLSHKKSDTKFIPDCFKFGSIETRRGVIEGMVLTDGCCDRYKVAIYSNSLRMLQDAEDIILSLGGRGKIYKDKSPANNDQHQQYKLQFSIAYVDKCGFNFRHKQPKHRLIRHEREDDVIIKSVVATGVKKCRCITVNYPTHAFVLGNGIVTYNSGKTTAGCVEFLMHMTQQYPDWYPKENRYDRPIKGRIVATDFSKGVGEVIIPALEHWMDTTVGGSFVAQKLRNPIGIPVKWVLKNGNQFDILTHEQSVEQFEGWSGDLAWFDEPPPRDKYIATRRGLVDNNGKTLLTLTPLKQPWIYDEIYTRDDPSYFTVTMDIAENPTQTKEAINEFTKTLSEEEREARLHGKFRHLSGLVFKEFDPEIHLWDNQKVKKHWSVYFAIDPHPRTPTACLWLAVDEHDQMYVIDELWLADMTAREIADAVKSQEMDYPARFRFIDPAMDKENELAGGFNVRKELMKYGIACTRANNDFDYGISKIREALRPTFLPLLKVSIPRLRISRQCHHLVYEFQHYMWDDYTMRPEDHDAKQRAKKKNDHFIDCLRYILNSNPRYFQKDEEDYEPTFAGGYTKYPSKEFEKKGSSSYYNLVEDRNADAY